MYAAESLVLLNRVNEAIPHLHPDNISKLSNFPLGQEPAHSHLQGLFLFVEKLYKRLKLIGFVIINADWFPATTQVAKVVLQYNLSAAYALRGEYEKAGELVRQVVTN